MRGPMFCIVYRSQFSEVRVNRFRIEVHLWGIKLLDLMSRSVPSGPQSFLILVEVRIFLFHYYQTVAKRRCVRKSAASLQRNPSWNHAVEVVVLLRPPLPTCLPVVALILRGRLPRQSGTPIENFKLSGVVTFALPPFPYFPCLSLGFPPPAE